jgi:aryl-alcohol dehydrogenase (NADP+)
VVKAGKARYIGASSMRAWQFAQALYLADLHGWTRFVSMQNYYNLLYREEEREMLPLCADQGIGSIPWSPLARGRLTRPWTEETNRSESDEFGRTIYTEDDRPIVEAVINLADKRGVTPAQIALAWMLSKPVVSSPIVGATKEHHLADAVAAVDLRLDDAEIELLEEGYQPHPVLGIDIGGSRPTR